MLAIVFAMASPAFAGSIKGTVHLGKAAEAEGTIVYIESVPEHAFTASPTVARLSQKGALFSPAVLPIVRGSQVDMSNDDWVSHNAFSRSAVKTFDLGLYAQDARRMVTFDNVGVVPVFCAIHPRMTAVILVLQNPFFARPAPDGRFSLDDVPPGTYQLKVYRPGAPATAGVTVKVPASGSVPAQF